jgi:hypothetical protein
MIDPADGGEGIVREDMVRWRGCVRSSSEQRCTSVTGSLDQIRPLWLTTIDSAEDDLVAWSGIRTREAKAPHVIFPPILAILSRLNELLYHCEGKHYDEKLDHGGGKSPRSH